MNLCGLLNNIMRTDRELKAAVTRTMVFSMSTME
jgi:hypothetical protein